jgi:hypothetical protein
MNPRFLRRIEQARNSLRAGRGVKLEYVEAGWGIRPAWEQASIANKASDRPASDHG